LNVLKTSPQAEPELVARIKVEAYRLGFGLAGVTTPDPPQSLFLYESWLAAGYHGEMAYLASERARQRRAEPRLILPGCRSILVLAAPYPAAPSWQDRLVSGQEMAGNLKNPLALVNNLKEPVGGLKGRVASYAWGADYHIVLPQVMSSLVDFIQAQVNRPVAYRYYTDSGPLLERELGQRAGLGWIGKNSCLIHPRLGSFFFLAEILLDLDLAPDPPFEYDRCGTCSRCIESCPTGCILPNRTLDARRCISYLTIELKGAIPGDLRELMGEWVFGCDICQQVCPWNWDRKGRAFPPVFPGLEAHPRSARPDLAVELHLSPQAFNQKFRGSAVQRAKRRGYLRNVAVAMGNGLRGSAFPLETDIKALRLVLETEAEELVREHAAWALGELW
jgi:epoxyqueuosine reductase